MNGSQLMGLDRVGAEIYDIHRYFCRLMVVNGPRVLGCHTYFCHIF